MLLGESEVGPIIPVSDLARSRTFYEEQLGLRGSETPGGWLLEASGGTRVYLLEVPQDAGSGGWPLASFKVPDVDAAVAALDDAGVEHADMTGSGFELDASGIARQEGIAVAWFTDPDGNIFTVFETAAS